MVYNHNFMNIHIWANYITRHPLHQANCLQLIIGIYLSQLDTIHINVLCFIGTHCLPARPSKPTGAAIENDRRGHRNQPARPSKMTGAAIETYRRENDRRGHRNLPARPSKMTGAAIETYRRGHRNLPARPSKMTGAAIETYRPIFHKLRFTAT